MTNGGINTGKNGPLSTTAVMRGLLSIVLAMLGALLYQSWRDTGRINTIEERVNQLQVSGSERVHVLEDKFDRARDTLLREDDRRNKELGRLEGRIDELDRRMRASLPQLDH